MYTEAAVRLIAELEQIIPEETAVLTLSSSRTLSQPRLRQPEEGYGYKSNDIEFAARHPNLRSLHRFVGRAGLEEECLLLRLDQARAHCTYKESSCGSGQYGQG